MVFALICIAFCLALAGLVVSLIQPMGLCICGCTYRGHAELIDLGTGRLPHGGPCKTCSCRTYIAK